MSNMPLYQGHDSPIKCDKNGHYGLWFERFFNQFDNNWKVLEPETNDSEKGKTYWLLKHFNNGKVGDSSNLTSYRENQQRLVKDLGGKYCIFKNDWHFVTGMGNPHPVENGFAWHPTLGVPYLTGAAVKGLVRSYLENHYDDENKSALLIEWFGSNDKDPQADNYTSQTGSLIFFDAIPIKPVTLVVDIMTPHMGKWYQEGETRPNEADTIPADWHDPVPVAFLATKDIHLQFSFALSALAKNKKVDIKLDDVAYVLEEALKHTGAGSKTSTGYGAFKRDEKSEEALAEKIQKRVAEAEAEKQRLIDIAAEEVRQAKMHPIEREINEFPYITGAIEKLVSSHWRNEADEKMAAKYLKQRMQQEKKWKEKSQKKKPEKDKDYQNTLKVIKYL